MRLSSDLLSHYSIHRAMLESNLCHEAFSFLGYTLKSLVVIYRNMGFCCPPHSLYSALLLSSYSTFLPLLTSPLILSLIFYIGINFMTSFLGFGSWFPSKVLKIPQLFHSLAQPLAFKSDFQNCCLYYRFLKV